MNCAEIMSIDYPKGVVEIPLDIKWTLAEK